MQDKYFTKQMIVKKFVLSYLYFSQEASLKRRVRRNVKAPKAVAGLSYTELLAKKQQKPEVRCFVAPQLSNVFCLLKFRHNSQGPTLPTHGFLMLAPQLFLNLIANL